MDVISREFEDQGGVPYCIECLRCVQNPKYHPIMALYSKARAAASLLALGLPLYFQVVNSLSSLLPTTFIAILFCVCVYFPVPPSVV